MRSFAAPVPGAPSRPWTRRAATALTVTIVLALGPTAGAATPDPGADRGPGSVPATNAPVIVPEDSTPIALPAAEVPVTDDPRVAPELAWVGADSDDYRRAIASYRDTDDQLGAAVAREADATRRYDAAVSQLTDLAAARPRVQGDLTVAVRRETKAADRLDAFQTNVRRVAVDLYVLGGATSSPAAALDTIHANENGGRRVYVAAIERYQLGQIDRYTSIQQIQSGLITTTKAQLDDIDRRAAATTTDRDTASADRTRAVADQARLRTQLEERRQGVADARLAADIDGIDFPFVVLNAYVRAANTLAVEKPTCRIRWSALAGIGKTESGHGTFGGSKVDGLGELTKPIYGPDLNGADGFALVPDSDGGEFDADPNGDRAAGAMQFIPGTWKTVGRDGNDDGRADPQNMYDAALTAAAYLCRQGPGLDGDAGLRKGFRSYNNDSAYVETVLARTHHYERYTIPEK